jgi:hypothetical protein
VNLACFGCVDQPVARNKRSADVAEAAGIDHVGDNRGVLFITGLGAKGCGRERSI